ncbi:hypothetical protein ACFQE5_22235 [Pseudonocardia hispaniensis]|uniref:Antitoxin VbhA domain-containing protein n=1 Tax=Pseudonocardia hispaniensis TaxID=904933 RepID=A0ABW1J7V4_9PSEU
MTRISRDIDRSGISLGCSPTVGPDEEAAAVRTVLNRYNRGQLSAAEAKQVLQMLGLVGS